MGITSITGPRETHDYRSGSLCVPDDFIKRRGKEEVIFLHLLLVEVDHYEVEVDHRLVRIPGVVPDSEHVRGHQRRRPKSGPGVGV